MNDNLKIQIVATLEPDASIREINAAITGIERKLNNINLKFNIDEKFYSTLNSFITATNNLKSSSNSLKSSLKEEETIIKKMDGSIEKVNQKYLKTGEIIQKTTRIIDQRKKAIEKETESINQQAESLEQLGKVQKEIIKTDAYGKQTAKNVTTKNNNANITYNYDANDQLKSTTNVINFAQQEKQIEKLRASLLSLYNQGKVNEKFFSNFNKVINSAKNVSEIEKVKSALERVNQFSNNKMLQQNLISNANALMTTHKKTVDRVELLSLIDSLKQVQPTASNASNSLKQMGSQLNMLKNEAKEASRSSMGLVDSFNVAMTKYPVWMAATTIFIGIPRLIRNTIDTLVDLDTKFINLQKVMNQDTNFDLIMQKATDSAKEFGKTLSETMDSYTEFARQGYKEDEIPLLANAALITSNVGEMDAGKAAEYLTSTLIQMKLEAKDAMSVIDKWNNISNNNATTVENLAQAYARAGSVMKVWNISMDEANAIIGTVTAATKQSGNEIGNFIKNILPRLTSAPAAKALDKVGVSLTDDQGNLRSALDIYKDVAKVYEHLSDLDKSIVTEGLAGKYHMGRMSAFLQNMDLVDKMYQDSVNSANSASNENEIYMKSLQSRINQTKAQFEQLALSVGDAFVTEGFIQFLHTMGDIASTTKQVTDKIGMLPIVMGGVATATLLMNKGFRQSITDMTIAKATAMSFGTTLKGLSITLKGLAATTGIGLVFAGIGFGIEKIMSASAKARQASEELAAKQRQLTAEFTSNKDAVVNLTRQYDYYSKIVNSGDYNLDELKEFNKIRNELGNLMPSLVQGEDSYGNKILGTTDNIKSQISMLERQAEIQERIEANKQKVEIDENYETAFENLKKQKSKLDDTFAGTFTVGGLKIENSKELDKEIQKYEKLSEEASKAGKSLNYVQQERYDALLAIRDKIESSTLDFETAQMSFQSAAMDKVKNTLSFDNNVSSSMKSIINDFTLYVAEIETDSNKVNDIFDALLNKISTKDFKKMFDGLNNAVDEYKKKIEQGLTGDELKPFEEKVVEMNKQIEKAFSKMLKGEGVDPKVIKEIIGNLDASVYSVMNLDDALNTLSKSTGLTVEELQAQLNLSPGVSDGLDGIADSASGAADSMGELKTAAEQIVGISSSTVSSLQEQVEVYRLLSQQENLSASMKSALLNATNTLSKAYPNLVKGKKINIEAISQEINAQNALLKAVDKATKGQLTSQETQTLNAALGTQARIDMMNRELQALQEVYDKNVKMMQKLQSMASSGKMDDDAAFLKYQKYFNINQQFSGKIQTVKTNLSDLIPKFKDYTSQLSETNSSIKDTTNSTGKYTDTVDKSTYVVNKYAKALEQLNLELEKQDLIQSKYPKWSDTYIKSLQQEIKLLEQKKKLIEAQAKDLNNQINSGNITQYGIVKNSSSSASSSYSGKYADIINQAAAKYGVSPSLIAGMIKQESNFNPNARSRAGAMGLMQLMPATAKSLGVTNAYDPTQNIMAGTKYIAQQLSKFGGNITKALYAYNAGAGNVSKILNSGANSWKEPKNYANKVLKYANEYGAVSSSSDGDIASYYLNNFKVTSNYGKRNGTQHKGVDFQKSKSGGELVKAVRGGKVITAAYSKSAGYWVVVQQDDGTVAKYMHMQKGSLAVKAGQTISAGATLGKVGTTGQSTGNHLHFQVEQKGKAVDPIAYLKKLGSSVSSSIAEQQQSIDKAKSELNGLASDLANIDNLILQARDNLAQAQIDAIEHKIQQQEKLALKYQNATYHMSSSSKEYRDELVKQRNALIQKQKLIEQEIDLTRKLLKQKNLSASMSAELKDKLENLMNVQRYENAAARDEITMQIINSTLKQHDDIIDALDYKLQKSQALREQMVKGSKEYNESIKDEIKWTEEKGKAILNKVNELEKAFHWQAMTPAQKKDFEKQINDLMLQYYNLNNNMMNSRNEIVTNSIEVLKKAFEKELELATKAKDNELKEYRKAHDEKMKLLDEEMQAYEKSINMKLREYNDQQSKDAYDKNLSKLQKEELEIQKKIDILKLDNSQDAIAKRIELEEQLKAKREEIEQTIYDREMELKKQNLQDALDKKKEEYEESKKIENDKLESFENAIEEEKKLLEKNYQERLQDEKYWADIRAELIKGNVDVMDQELNRFLGLFEQYNKNTVQNIGSTWSELQTLIDQIKGSMNGIGDIGNINNSIGNGGVSDTNAEGRIAAWQDYLSNKRKASKATTQAERDRLRAENDALRAKYGFVDGHYNWLEYLDISEVTNKDSNFTKMASDWGKYLKNKELYPSSKYETKQRLMKENTELRKKWNFPDGSLEDLKKLKVHADGIYHNGGITGGRGSKLANLLNNMANKDRIIKSQVGELNIPEKNMPNFIKNFASSIINSIKLPSTQGNGNVTNLIFNIDTLNGTQKEADNLASTVVRKLNLRGIKI